MAGEQPTRDTHLEQKYRLRFTTPITQQPTPWNNALLMFVTLQRSDNYNSLEMLSHLPAHLNIQLVLLDGLLTLLRRAAIQNEVIS